MNKLNCSFLLLLYIGSICSIHLQKENANVVKKTFSNNKNRFTSPVFGVHILTENKASMRKYSIAQNIVCSIKTTCPPRYGSCISPSECKCAYGFSNFIVNNKNLPDQNGNFCAYEQKKLIYAFLLESFLSLGLGHIYSGRYLLGYIKMIFCLLIVSLFLIQTYINKGVLLEGFAKQSPILLVIYLIFSVVWLIWQLLDMVLIGLNQYLDGNDIPLTW